MIPPDGSGDTKEERGVDPDACKILLNSPGKIEEGKEGVGGGYDRFHKSLISLMSCGLDYRLYNENLNCRVTVSYSN